MKRLLYTLILALLMPALAFSAVGRAAAPAESMLVVIPYDDWTQLQRLASLGLDVFDLQDRALATVITPAQLDRLRGLGYATRVIDAPAHPAEYYVAIRRPDTMAPAPVNAGQSYDYTAGLVLLHANAAQAERWTAAGYWIKRLFGGVALPTTPPILESPRARELSVDPLIQGLVAGVSSTELYNSIRELQDDPSVSGYDALGSRYSYSPKIGPKRDYIVNRLQALGLTVLLDHFTLGSGLDNVEATLPGWGPDPGVVYITCAHYDSYSQDPYNSAPGADDNASGTAGVLEAARVLSPYRFKHTLRFVTFAGEEQGMIGSHYYADRAASAHTDIRGVVNLDMIGWDSNHDNVMEVHAGTRSDSQLIGTAFVDANSTYGLGLAPQYITQGGDLLTFSDHSRFWSAGYPAIMAIEDWADHSSNYHETTDTLPTLRLSFAQRFVKATVATLAGLAEMIPPGLAIAMTGRGAIVPGQTVNLTVNYSNAGPTPATGVQITNTLGVGLTYVANSSGFPVNQPAPGVVAWQLGNVPAYIRQSFVVTLTAASGLEAGDVVTGTALIRGATSEDDLSDNQTRWTGFVPAAHLYLPLIVHGSP